MELVYEYNRHIIIYGFLTSLLVAGLQIKHLRSGAGKTFLFYIALMLAAIQLRIWFISTLTEPKWPIFNVLFFISSIYAIGPTVTRLAKRMMSFRFAPAKASDVGALYAAILVALWELYFSIALDYATQVDLIRRIYFELELNFYTLIVFASGVHVFGYLFHLTLIGGSMKKQFELGYTRYIIPIVLLPLISVICLYSGYITNIPWIIHIGADLLTVTILVVFIVWLTHPRFFETLEAEIKQKRYERTQLSGINMDSIQSRINEIMVEDELYKDESLRLAVLAEMLLITPNQLSRILNEQYGKNFNEFVNSYRVEAAKKLLLERPKDNVINIAYEVGFNSKSTFNSQFQNIAGQSPVEFRKKGESDKKKRFAGKRN